MRDSLVPSIERISPEEEPIVLPHLIHLLQDTVASGASVGFLPPLSAEDAQQYWSTVFQENLGASDGRELRANRWSQERRQCARAQHGSRLPL
jgi:hypothetical protein